MGQDLTTTIEPKGERRRIAFHEAAHAIIGIVVGHPCELVSIRPSSTWDGVAFPYERKVPSETRLDVPSAVLQPARARRHFEGYVMVCLAGQLGEELGGFFPHGYGETADERAAVQTAMSFQLSPRQRSLLERGDSDRESVSDDRQALDMAQAFAGKKAAFEFVAWLRAETKTVVYEPKIAQAIAAVADELLEHETVSGRRVRSIYDHHTRKG